MSRPKAALKVEFDGDSWFIPNGDAHKVDQACHGVHVNVASNDSRVYVAGHAEIGRGADKAKELWSAGVSAWFSECPGAPASCS